jgi:hypothetical protein
MAQNSLAINFGLAFLVIFILANLRFNVWIKILLIPVFSIIAGLISSLSYAKEPGSFPVFISSSFLIIVFVAVLYPITRKFFQSKKIKAEEKSKLEDKS